jgi:hypothetical protein
MGKSYSKEQDNHLKEQVTEKIETEKLLQIAEEFNILFTENRTIGAIAEKLRRLGAKSVSYVTPSNSNHPRKVTVKAEVRKMSPRGKAIFEELARYFVCLEEELIECKTELRKYTKLRSAVEEIQRTK